MRKRDRSVWAGDVSTGCGGVSNLTTHTMQDKGGFGCLGAIIKEWEPGGVSGTGPANSSEDSEPAVAASAKRSKTSGWRSKRRAAASKGVPSRVQWDDLPNEVQKRVLVSPALALPELARMAATSSVFRAVYLEHCASEERWLEGQTIAAFGAQAVNTLLRWLTFPQHPVNPTHRWAFNIANFHIKEGEDWPELSSLLPWTMCGLRVEQRFLMGEPIAEVKADFDAVFTGKISLWVRGENDKVDEMDLLCDLCSKGREVVCAVEPSMEAGLVPSIGFLYMACKALAEIQAPRRKCTPVGACSKGPKPVRIWDGGEDTRDCSWNDMHKEGLPTSAQRALAILHMWIHRFGRHPLDITLHYGLESSCAVHNFICD
eukprot:jgi/Botrbrau1/14519/Bobra.0223s0009.1